MMPGAWLGSWPVGVETRLPIHRGMAGAVVMVARTVALATAMRTTALPSVQS